MIRQQSRLLDRVGDWGRSRASKDAKGVYLSYTASVCICMQRCGGGKLLRRRETDL